MKIFQYYGGMYSKRLAFQIHQQKKKKKEGKPVNLHFLFSALIVAPHQRALNIVSSVHPNEQIVYAELINQSARFTQVVL